MTTTSPAELVAIAVTVVVAVAVTRAVTPVVGRAARARGWLDRPGDHKSHVVPVPYLGGVALVAGVLAGGLVGVLLVGTGADIVVATLAAVAALAVVGLWDDLREVPVWVRIVGEVAVAVALYAVGVRTQLAFVTWVDLPVTVLWVVGVTNAVNLVDNMDGLSSGVVAIAATGFALLAAVNGQADVAVLAAALAGACVGFLRHNRHPASIHLGDAGALAMGGLLAAVGMLLSFDAPRSITFAVPIMVVGVPLFDTLLVVVSRRRRGRSPFAGGRDHTSHRLTNVGLSVPVAVTLIHGAGLALTWLALVLSRVDTITGLLLQGFVLAVGTLAFVLLIRVEVD